MHGCEAVTDKDDWCVRSAFSLVQTALSWKDRVQEQLPVCKPRPSEVKGMH